jgi:Flp pilus assembly protein TadG
MTASLVIIPAIRGMVLPLHRLRGERRGSVSIEAALVTTVFLVPLLLGSVDFATVLATYFRVHRAQEAAVFYAWGNGGIASTATIQQAATTAFGTTSPSPTVTSSTLYYCVTTSQYYQSGMASYTSTPTCSSGQQVASYLTVSVSATTSLPVPFPVLPSSFTLTSTGSVRTQ